MLAGRLSAATAASYAVVAGIGLLSWYALRRVYSKRAKLTVAHGVVPIGHVASVFTKCVGTPRQVSVVSLKLEGEDIACDQIRRVYSSLVQEAYLSSISLAYLITL